MQAYEDDKRKESQVDRAGNNIMHMAVIEDNKTLFDTLYSGKEQQFWTLQ